MTKDQKTYTRFEVAQRIEHIVLIVTFTTLAVTGLVQKFAQSSISISIIAVLGGIEMTRIIHRAASVVFLVQAIYHLVAIGYKLYVERKQASMLPGFKDLQDAIQHFLYNLGLRKERPKMDRYNFVEKAEYWAMVWGLVLMALTGFMMWNPIATARLLPGQAIPAAKVAHGAEAILAVLAIFIWHFYHVHLKTFNKSMFTGKLSRHEMEEEHALELEKIEKGLIPPPPPPEVLQRRKRIYYPVAVVLSLILLFFVYRFVTFEETAITTVSPVSARAGDVFVPQTPTPLPTRLPTPTPFPTQEGQILDGPLSWNNGIGQIINQRCGSCHGAMGGLALTSYEAAMRGGRSGAAIVAGDVEASPLVTLVRDGKHPGKFESQELDLIVRWIQEGAQE
ncbi:MAG: cytochrome b/b6 domain-containing protein [Bellilinea sp.]